MTVGSDSVDSDEGEESAERKSIGVVDVAVEALRRVDINRMAKRNSPPWTASFHVT
jgi:hypothetical protein